ncbi:hypothetical protein [Paenibacillus sp. HJGM_3]|uniref:hypothetical protein n=1 Tax=Paenibacillus sp. HJGM_3 TaxID=3379816 RepID=UPI0038588A28
MAIQIKDREISKVLAVRLWYLRAFGTTVRWTHNGIKFDPVLAPYGVWDKPEDFEAAKRQYFAQYRNEIIELLAQLDW